MTAPNILVTGGAGFIGSHACKALRAAGYNPVTIDNLTTGHADAVRFGPLVQGDVRDTGLVAATLRDHQIAAVMHFAASAYVGESVREPARYYDNNVRGMIGLMLGCAEAGVDRIVFSSSCATYGVPDSLPIRETSPQNPINPYGQTKLICEHILRDISASSGLRYAALRYFNACGADPEGELGERHSPETHLLPLALAAAYGTAPPLQVFGTDYPTPDGTCIRDYIHVADLARAHVLAMDALMAGQGTMALNLGTGQGRSIREVLAAVKAVTGRDVPVLWGARRPGDPPALVADPTAARETLGFVAEKSDLETILTDAAPWFRAHEAA